MILTALTDEPPPLERLDDHRTGACIEVTDSALGCSAVFELMMRVANLPLLNAAYKTPSKPTGLSRTAYALVDGKAVAVVEANVRTYVRDEHHAMLSYLVQPEFRGLGFATLLSSVVARSLSQSHEALMNCGFVSAQIFDCNVDSERVALTLGLLRNNELDFTDGNRSGAGFTSPAAVVLQHAMGRIDSRCKCAHESSYAHMRQ